MAIEDGYSSDVTEEEIKDWTQPFRLHIWTRNWSVGEPSPFTLHPAIGWGGIKDALLRHYGKAEAWPVWKYEHGGIALSFAGERSWDHCQIGYLVLPHKEALLIHGRKRMSPKFRAGTLQEIIKERFGHLATWEAWLNNSPDPAITEASKEALYPTATWREQ